MAISQRQRELEKLYDKIRVALLAENHWGTRYDLYRLETRVKEEIRNEVKKSRKAILCG